jgi:glucokinase
MILAGDVGGTKTQLARFDARDGKLIRIREESYPSAGVTGLADAIHRFHPSGDAPLIAAAFGVAGPVSGGRVRTTNLPWEVDASKLSDEFGIGLVTLLNDLEAMAWGIEALDPADIETLQEGDPDTDGNGAVIAAGTGLGQALLIRHEGRLHPAATEGGHADFAPHDEEMDAFLVWLRSRVGHVSAERVASGMGLESLYHFYHRREAGLAPPHHDEGDDLPALLAEAASEERCPSCTEAFGLFLRCYGAEAGNLALKAAATSGVYVGGGIAAKNISAMKSGIFARAFVDKGRFEAYMRRIPLKVILNEGVPLIGAARVAARSAGLLD